MKLLKVIFLLPISLIYGAIVFLRNKFFDWGILKEMHFDTPVIDIGNLSMGGTGKTPHVEYLIELLKQKYHTAVLSRGYGRKTKGFIWGNATHSYQDLGDEPMQYLEKYSDIEVAVCEKRVEGVRKLLENEGKCPEVIILDDAFQHRYIKPGLNILLTDSFKLYSDNFIFPVGTLREFRSGAKRADIIVVTKTEAAILPSMARDLIQKKLRIKDRQKLYFSYIKYLQPQPLFDQNLLFPLHNSVIFMISGIVNPYPLEEYLKHYCSELKTFVFPDHHEFTTHEMEKILHEFNDHFSGKKLIVTTEKDTKRLSIEPIKSLFKNIPVFYVPISIAFHKGENPQFDEVVMDFVERK